MELDGGMIMCVFFKQKTAYEMRISDWSSDVCSSDLASIHPFVPRLIRIFRSRYPGVGVSLVEHSTLELVQRVHNGSGDLAFVRAPTLEMPGVCVETILSEPMLAVVPATHEFASRPAIDLRELARAEVLFSHIGRDEGRGNGGQLLSYSGVA